MRVNVKLLSENAVLPKYAKSGDACVDLVATSISYQGKFIEYGTGLALEIPEGFVGLIYPRSSVTNKDLTLANSVGVIDAGFRGEVKFRFRSTGADVYEVGERVGQIMIVPFPKIDFVVVDELSASERGEGGYGSTGK